MTRVFSIVFLNVKQGIREKTFWVVVFFFISLLSFSLFLGELSIGERAVVLRNVALSSIEISCLILIIFSLIFSFYREKDTHIKEVYLSYFSPITYLGGKLIGYIFICLTYILFATALAVVILFLNNAFLWQFFLGSYGIFLKLSIFCGICLLFSSFFEYPLLAVISSVFIYVSAELSYNAFKIVSVSKNYFITAFLNFFYHLLPNSDKIDFKLAAIYGEVPQPAFLINITLYVLIYILFSFFLTALVFLRKEH